MTHGPKNKLRHGVVGVSHVRNCNTPFSHQNLTSLLGNLFGHARHLEVLGSRHASPAAFPPAFPGGLQPTAAGRRPIPGWLDDIIPQKYSQYSVLWRFRSWWCLFLGGCPMWYSMYLGMILYICTRVARGSTRLSTRESAFLILGSRESTDLYPPCSPNDPASKKAQFPRDQIFQLLLFSSQATLPPSPAHHVRQTTPTPLFVGLLWLRSIRASWGGRTWICYNRWMVNPKFYPSQALPTGPPNQVP